MIEFALPGGDRGGAALQFGHVEQSGLVEVDEPVVLGAGGVEFAVQAGQLGGEQLVAGDRGVHRDGLLAGQQQGGVEQGSADLAEDELVEGVGADVALGAAPVLAARAAGRGCGSSSTGARCRCGRASCAAGAHAAGPAFDKAAKQPGAGFGAAGAPFGVVGAGLGGGLECLVGDDGRAGDRDPLGRGGGAPGGSGGRAAGPGRPRCG